MTNVMMYSDAITMAGGTFVSSMLVLIAYLLADNRESSKCIKLMQILCAVGIEALYVLCVIITGEQEFLTFAFILGTFVGTALVVHLGINLINKNHNK